MGEKRKTWSHYETDGKIPQNIVINYVTYEHVIEIRSFFHFFSEGDSDNAGTVGINKPILPRGCVSVVRLGDAERWHVWNAEVCIDLCSVLAAREVSNGGWKMNCLNEKWWFWVILNDFEIVWELCHWGTIPQLFWSSLSSLNTLWNWAPQQVKQYQSELTQISDTWCSGGDISKTTWHFRLATQI